MSDKPAWNVRSLISNLEALKYDRTQTRENVVPIQPHQLTKLHDTARHALAELVAIHAEGHSLMLREEEAQLFLRKAQAAVIEAIGEIGIKGTIVGASDE